MPQLGMAQDSGIIVSWQKKPGDQIKSTDILMEVETDKATMEVEAGRDGYLAEIRAEAGSDVPIGRVIAIISDRPDEVVAVPAPALPQSDQPSGEDDAEVSAEPVSQPTEIAPPMPVSGAVISAPADRVLASPKARRLANERGIDLKQLARQGVDQPFHVADLDKFGTWTVETGERCTVTASVKRKAFGEFAEWAMQESSGTVTHATIWLAFASAALRERRDCESEIQAGYLALHHGGVAATASDADLCGLAGVELTGDKPFVDVSVVDLTDTALDGYSGGGGNADVTFVVAPRGKKKLRLTLQFHQGSLSPERAADLLTGLCRRVAEPLRHLL